MGCEVWSDYGAGVGRWSMESLLVTAGVAAGAAAGRDEDEGRRQSKSQQTQPLDSAQCGCHSSAPLLANDSKAAIQAVFTCSTQRATPHKYTLYHTTRTQILLSTSPSNYCTTPCAASTGSLPTARLYTRKPVYAIASDGRLLTLTINAPLAPCA